MAHKTCTAYVKLCKSHHLKTFFISLGLGQVFSNGMTAVCVCVLQIPRYIITLHELLAHTPHNHVERKSLDHARMQLEDLSRQMHDEVGCSSSLWWRVAA